MKLRRGCSGAWIALIAAVIDRIAKAAVTAAGGGTLAEIPGLLKIRLTTNTGMAFSLLSGETLMLTILTAALTVGLTAWLIVGREGQSRLFRAGLWMIVGGGLGNLYDRIAFGHVIDFIEPTFVRFAVFNPADAFICIGAGLAVIAMIVEEGKAKETQHGGTKN